MKKIYTLLAVVMMALGVSAQSGSDASQVTFDFSTGALRNYAGKALTDVKGYIYNETFTVSGVSMQLTGGSAPSRLTYASNRDTCLIMYKEYATMQFKAPTGKAVTKIEFVQAGNGNLNLTTGIGTVTDHTWEGNADGVRFVASSTVYLKSLTVTLADKTADTQALEGIPYVAAENIAAFNALEAGTYVKLALTDAEVIGISADGYSTVFVQDATGGTLLQYTSLNAQLKAGTKVSGTVYAVKRVNSGNTQVKEALETSESQLTAADLGELSVIEGTIDALNVAANLGRVVKLTGVRFEATSATAGTLTQGESTITVNNGGATANQQLHAVEFAKGDIIEKATVVGILNASSATKNQILPISIVDETTVGIATVRAAAEGEAIYSLQGQRLQQLQRGLNIVNGRKVVVK